jgi:hypothetical protein
MDMFSIVWMIAATSIVVGLFVFLVLKTDKVVKFLRLDKGFDEDRIELGNLNSSDIIKIGSFIIGGLLIIENIPSFLSHLIFSYKKELIGIENNPEDNFYWLVSGLNLIIGYLLLTKYNFIAKHLNPEKKEKKQ